MTAETVEPTATSGDGIAWYRGNYVLMYRVHGAQGLAAINPNSPSNPAHHFEPNAYIGAGGSIHYANSQMFFTYVKKIEYEIYKENDSLYTIDTADVPLGAVQQVFVAGSNRPIRMSQIVDNIPHDPSKGNAQADNPTDYAN